MKPLLDIRGMKFERKFMPFRHTIYPFAWKFTPNPYVYLNRTKQTVTLLKCDEEDHYRKERELVNIYGNASIFGMPRMAWQATMAQAEAAQNAMWSQQNNSMFQGIFS